MFNKLKSLALISIFSFSILNTNQINSMELVKSAIAKVNPIPSIKDGIKYLFTINGAIDSACYTILLNINSHNLSKGIHSADPELKKILMIGFLYLLKRQLNTVF